MSDYYSYSPDTGEFAGAGVPDIDPLQPGKFIYPAHSTNIAPPVAGPNESAVFNGGGWELLPDFRGTTGWTLEGVPVVVTGFGSITDLQITLDPPEPQAQSVQAVPKKPNDAELVPDPEPPEDEELPPEPDPEPEPTLEEQKRYAKTTVVAFADELTEQVKNAPNGGVPYPAGEQAKWTQKEAEARAYNAVVEANGTIVETDYPYLWKLCGQDSSALATLVTAVLYHADRFEDAAVLIEQLRTQTFAAIDGCADQDQINAVLEATKATAMASVEALLAP